MASRTRLLCKPLGDLANFYARVIFNLLAEFENAIFSIKPESLIVMVYHPGKVEWHVCVPSKGKNLQLFF